MLPGRGQPGPALRRLVLHGREEHRYLLPPVLPGDDAEAGERHVLPERRRRAAGRVPRLQALPAGRRARFARVGRARRPGGPRDAVDRRRRGRPRGRAGTGEPPRLHRTAPQPPAHRGTRRRTAGPGAGAARADRPHPGRDDRSRTRGDRLRLGFRQRAAVQRHHPGGVRAGAERAAATPARRTPGGRRDQPPARLPLAAARPGPARLPGGAGTARDRGTRRRHVPPRPVPPARQRDRLAQARQTLGLRDAAARRRA